MGVISLASYKAWHSRCANSTNFKIRPLQHKTQHQKSKPVVDEYRSCIDEDLMLRRLWARPLSAWHVTWTATKPLGLCTNTA